MVRFNLNLDDVRGGEPTLPPGRYELTVDKISGEKTDATTPYAIVSFMADAGQHQERFYLSQKCLWRWKALISACGFDVHTVPADLDYPQDLGPLLDCSFKARIDEEEYQGSVRSSIKAFSCLAEGEKIPWPGSQPSEPPEQPAPIERPAPAEPPRPVLPPAPAPAQSELPEAETTDEETSDDLPF